MLAVTSSLSLPAAMHRRLSSIQSSNHEPVYVLGVVHFCEGRHPTKDAENAERQLHLKFKHLARFSLGSRGAEWFNAAPDLLMEISRLAQTPESLGIAKSVAFLFRRRRLRPNPSLEPTRTGMALGPLPGVVHHPSSGPSAIPALAPQLKR